MWFSICMNDKSNWYYTIFHVTITWHHSGRDQWPEGDALPVLRGSVGLGVLLPSYPVGEDAASIILVVNKQCSVGGEKLMN